MSDKAAHIAFISVGSNMGDRYQNCRFGIERVCGTNGNELLATSHFYETEPVDFLDQDWFVNAVFKIKTELEPTALLRQLQTIQKKTGRGNQKMRYGPRVLDLDILLYGRVILKTPDLTIPHPRMHKRRFVLKPFCDIAPDMMHPVLEASMKTLLSKLPEKGQGLHVIHD